jgi:tetratricopeptide (TPR) repeat protein
MDTAAFVQLVRDLIEAMGQRLEAARPTDEGLALRTADRYLYVFVADPARGSTETVRRWCEDGDVPADHLVVFSLEPLPLSWGPEVVRGGGTVISGRDFRRLVDELGIESSLVEKDPNIHRPVGSALPSARELDANMVRAQTWFTAGVLPLAARFYDQAVRLKPEFLPGWIGLARAHSGMGAWEGAELAWSRVLALDPSSLEAQLGLASIAGARGNVEREVAMYRAILHDHPRLITARVALIAALVEEKAWPGACREIEALLKAAPSDARLHFLHAVAIERSGGEAEVATAERSEARRLGLTEGTEQELLRSFGEAARPP